MELNLNSIHFMMCTRSHNSPKTNCLRTDISCLSARRDSYKPTNCLLKLNYSFCSNKLTFSSGDHLRYKCQNKPKLNKETLVMEARFYNLFCSGLWQLEKKYFIACKLQGEATGLTLS